MKSTRGRARHSSPASIRFARALTSWSAANALLGLGLVFLVGSRWGHEAGPRMAMAALAGGSALLAGAVALARHHRGTRRGVLLLALALLGTVAVEGCRTAHRGEVGSDGLDDGQLFGAAGHLMVLVALTAGVVAMSGSRDNAPQRWPEGREGEVGARGPGVPAPGAAPEARRTAEISERSFREMMDGALDPMIVVDARRTITMVNRAAETVFGHERGGLVGQPIEVLVPEKNIAETAIARYTRELERSNAELERFAFVVSHDLQEPLRMVAGFTELLAKRYRGKLGPDADQFIAHAVDGTRRMRELIRDLLEFSRAGTQPRVEESVSCEEVLAAALENLHLAIEESGASVTHDALPRVKADRCQLVQLFQNLVGNAIKFRAAAPPVVHVGAVREGERWVVSVADNGIGIDPRHSRRVFELFKRLHHGDEFPGTGIGLAVCKRIVERHGGEIWLDSRVSEGSVFHFTLPCPEAEEERAS